LRGPQTPGYGHRRRCRWFSSPACAPSSWTEVAIQHTLRHHLALLTAHSFFVKRVDPSPRAIERILAHRDVVGNSGLPSASTKNEALRYSAPPLAACTKLPSRPHANRRFEQNRTLPGAQLARRQARQRALAAYRPMASGLGQVSRAARALYQSSRCIPLRSRAIGATEIECLEYG